MRTMPDIVLQRFILVNTAAPSEAEYGLGRAHCTGVPRTVTKAGSADEVCSKLAIQKRGPALPVPSMGC